jgi:hypothetical protein
VGQGEGSLGDEYLEGVEVERAGAGIEPEDGDQQRRRGNEGEEEEFEGGFWSVFAAVHGDEDGHGDEREFPEAVVEHQVERDEDAEHGGLLDEEEREVDFAALGDGVPTGEHADGCEQAGEDYEPEAEAVDANVVEDGWIFNPGNVGLKLEAVLTVDEMRRQVEGEAEGDERREKSDPIRKLFAVGEEYDEHGTGKGCEEDPRENRVVDSIHSQWPAIPR